MIRKVLITIWLTLPLPLAAQSGWTIAPVIKWPLLDLSVQRDTADLIKVASYPFPAATQAPELRYTFVKIESVKNWIVKARNLMDSVEALPVDKASTPVLLSLPTTDAMAALSLAYDLREKTNNRYFIRLTDFNNSPRWTAYAGRKDVDALMALLEGVAAKPAAPAPFVNTTCEGLVLPQLLNAAKATTSIVGFPGQGGFAVTFILDTTGKVIQSTVVVEISSGPKFTTIAEKVLKEMTFSPARCPSGPVQLLATQKFFRDDGWRPPR